MKDREERTSTKLVHGGRRKEWRRHIVNPPVERASTILFDSVAQIRTEPASVNIITDCTERRLNGRSPKR